MPARLTLLLLLAFTSKGIAEEINPVRPKGVVYLENPGACVAVAEELGVRLLESATTTAAGITFGRGPYVYRGDAGTGLLFAGLYRATKASKWRIAAERTLSQAVATGTKGAGLYTGRGGVGAACLEAYSATGKRSFLRLAVTCAEDLEQPMVPDIISGAAGTLVFLLNLHRATKKDTYVDAAHRLGEYLVSKAVRSEGKAHWSLGSGKSARVYLGFSHGAAGIGYALLHLWRRTDEKTFRTVAEEAAAFVLEHEETVGEEGAHWWRTVPRSSRHRRIQWCHGAPGTGLFFLDLSRLLEKQHYADATARCLATTRARGRTARASGCQCHGVSGNAELFLEAYAQGGGQEWLHEARRSGSALLVPQGAMFRVRKASGRRNEDPAYMTGLSGIGHFFLRLADAKSTPLPLMVKP